MLIYYKVVFFLPPIFVEPMFLENVLWLSERNDLNIFLSCLVDLEIEDFGK